MSAYLKFFELEKSPFDGKSQSQVVLGTRALREAFSTIQSGLDDQVSRICVNGGPGLGKTSLARALPKLLGADARVALVLDPTISWEGSRTALAKQWGIESGGLARTALIEAAREKRLVLVIDQAERATEDFLDHLDVLLSYRSDEDTPIVQSVLLARLESTNGASPSPLVWWLDRIQTLQLEFAPLPRDGVASYIHKHLKRAGWRGERLVEPEAAHAIHGYTGGVPGEISALCERLLVEAATRGLSVIDADFVHATCDVDALEGAQNARTTTSEHERETEAEVWTLPDNFEALALEEEFAGNAADAAPRASSRASSEAAAPDTRTEPQSEPAGAQGADETAREAEESSALSAALDYFESAAAAEDNREATASSELEPPASAEDAELDESPAATLELDQVVAAGDGHEGARESGDPEAMDAGWVPEWGSASELDPYGDDLLAPPTEEELRAIRGSAFSNWLRPIAGTAIAVVIAGIGFALLGGDDEAPSTDARRAGAHSHVATPASPAAGQPPGTRGATGLPRFSPTAANPFAPAEGFVSAEAAGARARSLPEPTPAQVRPEPTAAAPPRASGAAPRPRADERQRPVSLLDFASTVPAENFVSADSLGEPPEEVPAAPLPSRDESGDF